MRGYNKYLILFLLPFFILFLTFNILPILYTFFVSFHKVQFSAGGASLSFVGFTNYLQVFNDPLFWTGLRNVLLILGIQVPVMTGLALILALLLNSPLITGKSFFQKHNIFSTNNLISTRRYILELHVWERLWSNQPYTFKIGIS